MTHPAFAARRSHENSHGERKLILCSPWPCDYQRKLRSLALWSEPLTFQCKKASK